MIILVPKDASQSAKCVEISATMGSFGAHSMVAMESRISSCSSPGSRNIRGRSRYGNVGDNNDDSLPLVRLESMLRVLRHDTDDMPPSATTMVDNPQRKKG